MKQNLLKVAVVGAAIAVIIGGLAVAAVAGFTAGQAQGAATAKRSHWYCDEAVLDRLPTTLNITVMQMDKVRRITDRAKPQLATVKNDARQRKQAIMDASMSEIAQLLTPEQQKKFDELQKARQDARLAKAKLHDALETSPSPFDVP
jgi:Spy/CpxP family protein refolding chaperone